MIALILFTSCGSFLKESSGDLLIPKTVDQYAALLYGEGYPDDDMYDAIAWIQLMTDDIELAYLNGDDGPDEYVIEEGEAAYTWDYDVEVEVSDDAWGQFYSYILGCNLIIDALPEITYTDNEIDEYNHLAASAYALRAYYYLCLVNWYAKVYSEENLDELGVVLATTPDVSTDGRERGTIRETYELINSDIALATEYIANAGYITNKYLISSNAVKFLANRIALFQEKWDEVISIGEDFMSSNSTFLDLKDEDSSTFGLSSDPFTMLNSENEEIIFTFGEVSSSSNPYLFLAYYFSTYESGFRIAQDLLDTYEDGDLRRDAYYMHDFTDWGLVEPRHDYPTKFYGKSLNNCYFFNWRNVEIVLNLAEAYTRQSNAITSEAVDYLNTIRENRFDSSYVPLTTSDFSSSDDLLQFIYAERRREFAMEETIRWWDMRRSGQKQVLHNYYISSSVTYVYELREESPNYVMQIPKSETNYNSSITANDREYKQLVSY